MEDLEDSKKVSIIDLIKPEHSLHHYDEIYKKINPAEFKFRFIVSSGGGEDLLLGRFFQHIPGKPFYYNQRYNLYQLARHFSINNVDLDTAKKIFLCTRYKQLKFGNISNHQFLEINHNYFSLIPIIRDLFPDFKYVRIIRDGRDSVTNFFNRGFYHDNENNLPKATDFYNDKYKKAWDRMTSFEKCCWLWVKTDSMILDSMQNYGNSITLKYENLFNKAKLIPILQVMFNFLDIELKRYYFAIFDKLYYESVAMTKRIEKPDWTTWTPEMKKSFEVIAGEHMSLYDYNYQSWK